MSAPLPRRTFFAQGGALVVSFTLPRGAVAQPVAGAVAQPAGGLTTQAARDATSRVLDPSSVDGFFAVHQDGSITCYSGKVDLGQGLRIALRQMAAEELDVPVERITLVEGDTALTPDQGPTAGSTGIMRGGVQLRQAAATARAALVGMAAEQLKRPAADLVVIDGVVKPRDGGDGVSYGALVGTRRFDVKLDPKAPLKAPATYRVVGKPLARPDLPAKLTGQHVYVHDFAVPGMLHGRALRPPRTGAKLVDVDASSIASLPGVDIVRKGDFVGVVSRDEWTAVRAARMLKLRWSEAPPIAGASDVAAWLRAGPFEATESLVKKGDAAAVLATKIDASAPASSGNAAAATGNASSTAPASTRRRGTYYWPMQTHGSIGPSCAVADVRADRATVWTASQATHKYRPTFARFLGLPADAVRLVYLDGAGCYGMNGHDDAAADAALMSQLCGKPVRAQWMRADEHGWDPKGPPQLIEITASLGADGAIDAWRTEMWLPRATAGLPNIPLLAPGEAGIAQPQGLSTGLITQNGDPPYAAANVEVVVHWLKDAPLRPSNIRAPGKIANILAVEAMTDELADAAGLDPVAFRLRHVNDARGSEAMRRCAERFGWTARQVGAARSFSGRGHGFAYTHYKHNETYVAMAMEVDVDRASGAIHVRRVVCAHDCGLMINPDGVRAQVEGNILQTLSRALLEDITFDADGVASRDWASYPILRFKDMPAVTVELIDRPSEPPLGAGEASAVCVGAALANAVYDAVGVRLRTVPFNAARVKAALA